MKNLLLLIVTLFVLSSCNNTNKEITAFVTGADSVAINYFKGDGTMDTVVAVKIISDRQKIDRLAALIGERSHAADYKCGYDGSLHFFKMNKVIQDVDFRMDEKDCMYFTFLQLGKHQATVLSPEAKELITAMRKQ